MGPSLLPQLFGRRCLCTLSEDLPEGFTVRSDGNLVAPDGVVMGSEEDRASLPVFQLGDPVVMHPDFAGAIGPVIHGPDPRMAPHLMP